MSDISLWMSGFALIVSVASAGFSFWSASEAKKSRRIQQAELLAQHFDKISAVLNHIKSGKKFDTTSDEILSAVGAIGSVRGLLPDAPNLQGCLGHLLGMLTKEHPYGTKQLFAASEGYSIERFLSEHGETIKTFESQKCKYLNIG